MNDESLFITKHSIVVEMFQSKQSGGVKYGNIKQRLAKYVKNALIFFFFYNEARNTFLQTFLTHLQSTEIQDRVERKVCVYSTCLHLPLKADSSLYPTLKVPLMMKFKQPTKSSSETDHCHLILKVLSIVSIRDRNTLLIGDRHADRCYTDSTNFL